MSYKNERHAARRARIEAERAERRREEEARLAKRKQKKKSSSIIAKWYWKGGVKIAGVPVRGGFFYAGANMKDMVEPNVPEPSLLNPTLSVADSSEKAEPLPPYPLYQFISDEQRKGYIDFLASDRSKTDDIGYVFLYLYGLERRLLLDAKKPGEVSDEERESIVAELIRIHKAFADQSKSLAHYLAMLFLYDGSVFKMDDYELLDSIFELSSTSLKTQAKTRQNTDNYDALSYMLVSRLKENGYDVPVRDLISAAKGRLMRGSGAIDVDVDELYDSALEQLVYERVSYVDMDKLSERSARAVRGVEHPIYQPSSPMIRKSRPVEIHSRICQDPEKLGVPLASIADMINKARLEIKECRSVMATTSLRDIDKVAIDALSACSPEGCALDATLATVKSAATCISMDTLDKDLKKRFGQSLQYTSKGTLSLISQQLISAVVASNGWQAVCPDTIEGLATASWRVDKNSKIVLFRRGMAHSKKTGRRCVGMIFGKDQDIRDFTIPGSWLVPSCLGYVYAWFIAKCGDSFSRNDLFKFSADLLPDFVDGIPANQKTLFFALMYATYYMNLSTHGIKNCLAAVPFESVQALVFPLVDDAYGRMIPPNVMAVLEELYKKAGRDKDMVLYDYQSKSYHLNVAKDIGFSIDEERLADTIKDTSQVHSMLNDAIGSGEDEVEIAEANSLDAVAQQMSDTDEEYDNDAVADAGATSNDIANDADTPDNDYDAAMNSIKGFFGDDDEAQTQELLAYIIEQGFAATTADATSLIASINEHLGEEMIEIDGPDVYLN